MRIFPVKAKLAWSVPMPRRAVGTSIVVVAVVVVGWGMAGVGGGVVGRARGARLRCACLLAFKRKGEAVSVLRSLRKQVRHAQDAWTFKRLRCSSAKRMGDGGGVGDICFGRPIVSCDHQPVLGGLFMQLLRIQRLRTV